MKIKDIKVSTLIFFLIIIIAILLVVVTFQKSPNGEAISTFNDILKVLAGALAGAIAGEKKNG